MSASATRPNLLLISFDDAVAFWKYKAIFGELLQTPNLDRICAQSTAFHAAYCQAPVCSPSRASLMSGKSPHHSGVTGPDPHYFDKLPPQQMWPYQLRQNGYFCSSGGKVMRGFAPLPKAVHEALYSDGKKKFNTDSLMPRSMRMKFGGHRGGRAAVDEKDDNWFYDYQSADSAITFLKRYRDVAPFYREVGFFGPHSPWMTPRRFKEMYRVKSICKPAAWKSGFDENDFVRRMAPENIDNSRLKIWKNSVRNYFSALSHTDHHLGRVWDALKASRHADTTLVIILSDHGFHLGERNLFRKHTLWEQVANVPLILHDPARPDAQVVSDPVGLIDVGPTVMDYLGLPPIRGSVGRSLRPQINWERAPDRAVPTFLDHSAAIRKGKYRFIRYEDGSTQLYDLSRDWWQTTNLGRNHPDYAAMAVAHAACCREYGFDVALRDAA